MIELPQFLAMAGFGLMLGLMHAFEPDHIAAVSTIASQTKSMKQASFSGIAWGLGHSFILLLIGFFVLISKTIIPETIASAMEFSAGIILVLLGFDLLIKVIKNKIHLHLHRHKKTTHIHFHSHKDSYSHNHSHKSFFVGIVH